jgi:hypothetical protein
VAILLDEVLLDTPCLAWLMTRARASGLTPFSQSLTQMAKVSASNPVFSSFDSSNKTWKASRAATVWFGPDPALLLVLDRVVEPMSIFFFMNGEKMRACVKKKNE